MMVSNSFPPNSPNHQENEELVEEVVMWLVKMSSDDCTQADYQAFEEWKNQDAQREKLIKEYQTTLSLFSKLKQQNRSKTVVHTLEQAFSQTQQSLWHLRSFFVLLGMGLLMLLLWHTLPTQQWFADTKNEYNQWNEEILSDHSQIQISGSTAYDVVFKSNKRLIQLYRGNILVNVAKDTTRPFIIETKYARITALGTRFIVNQNSHSTVLTMLESKTLVEPSVEAAQKLPQQKRVVLAGQQIIIDENGTIEQSNISPELYESAWHQKMLVVKNMPLPDVLSILQTYQSEKMTFNKQELEDIKLSATLPLNHSAIELVTNSVNVQEQTGWFGQTKIRKK